MEEALEVADENAVELPRQPVLASIQQLGALVRGGRDDREDGGELNEDWGSAEMPSDVSVGARVRQFDYFDHVRFSRMSAIESRRDRGGHPQFSQATPARLARPSGYSHASLGPKIV